MSFWQKFVFVFAHMPPCLRYAMVNSNIFLFLKVVNLVLRFALMKRLMLRTKFECRAAMLIDPLKTYIDIIKALI